MTETALVPRATIAEVVEHRDLAVDAFERYFEAIEGAQEILSEAHEAVRRACDGSGLDKYIPGAQSDEVEAFRIAIKTPNFEQHKRVARRLVDIQVWSALIERSELDSLMDKKAKDDLRKQMAYVPERVDRNTGALINEEEISKGLPPVTEETVLATLEGFREQSGHIWRRGIAQAFSKLDRRFRSHDGFKIGSRIIIDGAFDSWGTWNHFRNHRDTILDIERVFLVLDGKSPRAAYGSIIGLIDEGRRGKYGTRQSVHEGSYFRVRIFKNGNAHLWFTRKDLVEKVNKLLAEHYGQGLGWGSEPGESPEAPFEGALERGHARNFGFFPTPEHVAELLISEAALYRRHGESPLEVLEPSAGTGNLARKAVEKGAKVTAIEIQPELVVKLRDEGFHTICANFLNVEPERTFDRVLMNPPFDRGRDIDHVHHALKFLRPGGLLLAVMSAGSEWSSTAKAKAFWQEVKGHYWKTWDLPEGSFREQGTEVNTILLRVRKGTVA